VLNKHNELRLVRFYSVCGSTETWKNYLHHAQEC